MDSTTIEPERQAISLLESLNQDWFKLPMEAMQQAGPAVQTLAGIMKMTNKETFVSANKIAAAARVPLATCRKHLVTLSRGGWIENRGREHTPSGRPRRTATIAVTSKTRLAAETYAVLPRWACRWITGVGQLPWPAKAVLAIVLGRLMSLKVPALENGDGTMELDGVQWGVMLKGGKKIRVLSDEEVEDRTEEIEDGLDYTDPRGLIELTNEEDLIGEIGTLGDRFRFSLDTLSRQTGLSRESVVLAKRWLYTHGIVRWSGGAREDGGSKVDALDPNWDFRVVETTAGPGKAYFSFCHLVGGSESG